MQMMRSRSKKIKGRSIKRAARRDKEVTFFMAKDPAFLFYSTDFFMGTIDMTDEQVGQYTADVFATPKRTPDRSNYG